MDAIKNLVHELYCLLFAGMPTPMIKKSVLILSTVELRHYAESENIRVKFHSYYIFKLIYKTNGINNLVQIKSQGNTCTTQTSFNVKEGMPSRQSIWVSISRCKHVHRSQKLKEKKIYVC